MTRTRLYLLLTFFLAATVPWFFTKSHATQIYGFPPWAFYSFCATILYAVIVAFCLRRYWSVSVKDDDDPES